MKLTNTATEPSTDKALSDTLQGDRSAIKEEVLSYHPTVKVKSLLELRSKNSQMKK